MSEILVRVYIALGISLLLAALATVALGLAPTSVASTPPPAHPGPRLLVERPSPQATAQPEHVANGDDR